MAIWFCNYTPSNPDGSLGEDCGTKFRDDRNINQVTCPNCGTSGSYCCIGPVRSSDYVKRDLT